MFTRTRSRTQHAALVAHLIPLVAALAACDTPPAAPLQSAPAIPSALATPTPAPSTLPTPSVAALREEGLAHLRSGDLTAAEAAFAAALALAPNDASVHYHMGALRLEQGDVGPATEALERAVDLDGTNAEAFIALGQVYRTAGDLEQAERVLAAARDLDPTNPRVYYHLGLVYRDQGAFGPAIEAFEQYLSMVPDEAPDQAAAAGAVQELRDDISGEWITLTHTTAGYGLRHPHTWTHSQEGARLVLAQRTGGPAYSVADVPTVVFEMWPAEQLREELGIASLADPTEVVLAAAAALGAPDDQVQTADFDGHPAALVDVSAEVRGRRYYGTLAVILLEDRVLRVDGAGPARQWSEVRSLCIDIINSVFFTD